ncbi:helix-turn-helix domain-containing protein [Streptomyces hebeiensis]
MHLRHATTHDVLACWFGVDRSTVVRAIGGVRPLLAERGCAVSPGVRCEVVDHLGAVGKTGIVDGNREPRSGRAARRAARTARRPVRRQSPYRTVGPRGGNPRPWLRSSGPPPGRARPW